MINQNIKNWLAITKDNKYITIDKVKDNKENYYCPCCNEILRGRALESELMQPHFYHLQNDNLNSCNYENAYKRYWKENLITLGEIINIPFLGNITCIELKNNYKINEYIVADIYIKTNKDKEVLIFFDPINFKCNNLKYDILYLNFLQLELNKSNLKNCIELIHSIGIDNINNKFKSFLNEKYDRFKKDITTCKSNLNIDINNYINLQEELKRNNYYKEYSLISELIIKLQERQKNIYKYKNSIIGDIEIIEFKKLIDKLIKITNYNKDIDINILKKIDYNIYKIKWNKSIYFDFIKPISNSLKEYILQLENIIK